jgi:hypothetical protein
MKPINGSNLKQGYNIYPFLFGRNAIHAAALYLKETHNSISVPAYICGDVIEAIASSGLKVKFYDVLFDPTHEEFRAISKIDDKIPLLIVNYFGMKFALATGVKPTIVDNAFSFKLTPESEADFIIYSLRKQLPTPNGALLLSRPKINIRLLQTPANVIDMDDANYLNYLHGKKQGSSHHPGLSEENIYGPRYAEFGGYSLTKPVKMPSKNALNIRSASIKKQFQQVLSLLERYGLSGRLIIANAMRRQNVDIPTFLPIFVKKSVDTYDRIINSGIDFNKAIPFWANNSPWINMSTYPYTWKLKHCILVLSFIYPWDESDYIHLEELLKKELII